MVSHRMLAESMHKLQTKGLRRTQSGTLSSAPQTVWSPIIDSLLAVERAVDSRFAGFRKLWNVLKSLEGPVSNLVVPYTRIMVGSILADGSIGAQQVIRILLLLSDVILVLKPLETKKFQVFDTAGCPRSLSCCNRCWRSIQCQSKRLAFLWLIRWWAGCRHVDSPPTTVYCIGIPSGRQNTTRQRRQQLQLKTCSLEGLNRLWDTLLSI